jgi:hypothetical protein
MKNMLVIICFLLIGPVYAIDDIEIEKQPFMVRTLPKPRSLIQTIKTPTDGVPIRLDDGSTGQLALKQLDKVIKGSSPGEDYKISIKNSKGTVLGEVNVVACYYSFQLAILDLIGGPGDEIVFISQDFHASRPIIMPVLTIYRLDKRGLVAIGSTKVASPELPCAFYVDQAELDLAHKPVTFKFVRQWETCDMDLSELSEFAIKKRCLIWSDARGRYKETLKCPR